MFSATAHLQTQLTQPASQFTTFGSGPAAVSVLSQSTWGSLFSLEGLQSYTLDKHVMVAGRTHTNDIVIADERISGIHFVITREEVASRSPSLSASTSAAASPACFSLVTTGGNFHGGSHGALPSDVQSVVSGSTAPLSTTSFGYPHGPPLAEVRARVFVEDRSMNGTYVNGRRVPKGKAVELKSGDELCLVMVAVRRGRDAGERSTPPPTFVRSFGFHCHVMNRTRSAGRSETNTQNTVAVGPAGFPSEPLPPVRLEHSSSLAPRPPPKVLNWRWGDHIGSGVSADVYRGLDLDSGRMIAIKRIKAPISGDGGGGGGAGGGSYPPDGLIDGRYSSETMALWNIPKSEMLQSSHLSSDATAGPAHGDNNSRSTDSIALDSASAATLCGPPPPQRQLTGSSPGPRIMRRESSGGDQPFPPHPPARMSRGESMTEEFAGLDPVLRAELDLLKAMNHHRVVQYYGFAAEDGHICILLEYVGGGSLQTLLQQFGAFEESVVRIYATQMLQGLEYIHRCEVVHGDIKPANILVSQDARIKLSDFGSGHIASTGRRQAEDVLVGTPCFMSPEMVRTNKSTFASDIWAFGCTLLQLATGAQPWAELNLHAEPIGLIYQIGTLQRGPSLEGLHAAGASKAFIHLVESCFVLPAEHRPTASELLAHPFVIQGTLPQTAAAATSTSTGHANGNGSATANGAAPPSTFMKHRQFAAQYETVGVASGGRDTEHVPQVEDRPARGGARPVVDERSGLTTKMMRVDIGAINGKTC